MYHYYETVSIAAVCGILVAGFLATACANEEQEKKGAIAALHVFMGHIEAGQMDNAAAMIDLSSHRAIGLEVTEAEALKYIVPHVQGKKLAVQNAVFNGPNLNVMLTGPEGARPMATLIKTDAGWKIQNFK